MSGLEKRSQGSVNAFASLVPAGDSVATVEEFRVWTRSVIRPLIPHEMLSSNYGRLHAGGVSLDFALLIDTPTGYLRCIQNAVGGIESPILRAYLTTGEPQLFELLDPWPDLPQRWLECFQEHDMRNAASYGKIDPVRCVVTYHSFYRIPGRLGRQHVKALRALVPIMHNVLGRVVDRLLAGSDSFTVLTPRENEIVNWVGLGRNNREIAALSDVSENTVKHHLTNIFAKLRIGSRTQLMSLLAQRVAKGPTQLGPKIL